MALAVANRLVTADSRWVVSGTPAKSLLGVEVDMSADENLCTPQIPKTHEQMPSILDVTLARKTDQQDRSRALVRWLRLFWELNHGLLQIVQMLQMAKQIGTNTYTDTKIFGRKHIRGTLLASDGH